MDGITSNPTMVSPCMLCSMPPCARFAFLTLSCDTHAPADSAPCCTENEPQNPPEKSHCSPGCGPRATAEYGVTGGWHLPGCTHVFGGLCSDGGRRRRGGTRLAGGCGGTQTTGSSGRERVVWRAYFRPSNEKVNQEGGGGWWGTTTHLCASAQVRVSDGRLNPSCLAAATCTIAAATIEAATTEGTIIWGLWKELQNSLELARTVWLLDTLRGLTGSF